MTGELHIGHALQLAMGDLLIRMRRMQGYNALFQPGYDHAGISTQAAVEKFLAREGKPSREEMGREAFVELVWEWLHSYGGKIMTQFRRMGASLDYRRERFTMDAGYSRAVLRFFVHLYEKGWIYRDNRIINWCPFHHTSLSDLELVHADVDDTLTTIKYPLADGSGHIAIATVRPATILGDVAVAVHPDDERYKDLVGKEAIVPFVERRVPIIADERVERDFGTGALKVTPGHDPMDFAIGRDHGLPEPSVIGPDGRMNPHAGELDGLTQEEAGKRILDWIKERDLLVSREHYRHSVALCERCESRIEPLISLQWWCSMEELKKPALEVLRDRKVVYHPESQHTFAILSLENAPDWCISRQIWWGHQIPIWYCPDGHISCAETAPDACAECGSKELIQETDVLDTWFSSALWPFATLGWPDPTADLEHFYPGDLQTTGREIIRLWENRMIFCGLELLGRAPVPRRDHPLDGAGARRPADVEEPRHRHRPARRRRRARRGRGALRPPEDVVDAGRALLVRRGRGGAQAREQALERGAAVRHERGRHDARVAAAGARGAVDPRPARRRAGDDRGGARALRLCRGRRHALPRHLRRVLRLVRGGDQAAARRGGRAGDGVRGARAAAEAAPSGHAARDRGDLDAAAGAPSRA